MKNDGGRLTPHTQPLSRLQARLVADVWMSDGDARHSLEERFLVREGAD